MLKQSLDGTWTLAFQNQTCQGKIPGSVYSFLLNAGLMPDPYDQDNEQQALDLMQNDSCFSRSFTVSEHFIRQAKQISLCCEGLDTLAEISLNGQLIGTADNMHRRWQFAAGEQLRAGENTISIVFRSPVRWIRQANQADYLGGSQHAMAGFPHLRKAHCMFGWDWGPRLPDEGIWRSIYLQGDEGGQIEDLHIRQSHRDGQVWLNCAAVCQGAAENDLQLNLLTPQGCRLSLQPQQDFLVPEPELWWPNGLGEQPLYTISARLLAPDGRCLDQKTLRIGLRQLTVQRVKDQYGESFTQCCNGVPYFAMGADYIPEDNLLSRVTPARTRRLLTQCKEANFNSIRVWGGGYYPDDFFYDSCDELGLVVWQDFMFACANYHLTEAFEASIKAEFRDNIRRLRHHAALGLWCGNNEMEMFQAQGTYDGTCKTRSDYIRMFEHILPEMLRELDPDTFYWPASPSSGGGFDAPNDPDRGDVHYWEVWHGSQPYTAYRSFFFRYVSEFGFQAFPGMRTIESFTRPQDRNVFSRIMELHQRNEGANGKILSYLSQTYLYPGNLELLVYASQLMQADAIRYGVEHWRRNRGRCMGAIYWQLNDIWPVASWASIDYFGRWKALHYAARRFFSPVLISCEEVGETDQRPAVVSEPIRPLKFSARLAVSNESREPVTGRASWALRDNRGTIITQGSQTVEVAAQSSLWLESLAFPDLAYHSTYLSYSFTQSGQLRSAGTVLFTQPKHFHFLDPKLTYVRDGQTLTISAQAYAQRVEVYAADGDLRLSDNFFDLNADSKTVEILEGTVQDLKLRSVYDIR
ncbi:MAG: glycoside hydrolase family 2 protein [Oscillospiraceae bacterium]|nr:glycoside hydrolase family 2 protein [Oscillospiraceae bacterium]MDD4367588.1 glycoside hydrolase family 2 protein [Oscillospiraceae bacterium]